MLKLTCLICALAVSLGGWSARSVNPWCRGSGASWCISHAPPFQPSSPAHFLKSILETENMCSTCLFALTRKPCLPFQASTRDHRRPSCISQSLLQKSHHMLYRSHQTQPANRWQVWQNHQKTSIWFEHSRVASWLKYLRYLAFRLVQHVGATINSAQTSKGLSQHAEFQFIMKLKQLHCISWFVVAF